MGLSNDPEERRANALMTAYTPAEVNDDDRFLLIRRGEDERCDSKLSRSPQRAREQAVIRLGDRFQSRRRLERTCAVSVRKDSGYRDGSACNSSRPSAS